LELRRVVEGTTKCADGGDSALFELSDVGEFAQVLDLAEA
jgi:hypothetical protein